MVTGIPEQKWTIVEDLEGKEGCGLAAEQHWQQLNGLPTARQRFVTFQAFGEAIQGLLKVWNGEQGWWWPFLSLKGIGEH